MNFKLYFTFFVMVFSFINFISCKTTPISELSQDDGMARIKKNYSDKDWTEVITDVDEYKARYPYSKYTQEADLMQADAYYQSGRYPETIVAYEDFIRKNPSNKNAALANYRIAKSYDFQAPDNIDRDQANSKKGFDKYTYYLQNYPATEWIEDAKQRKEILNRRIADHDDFVANFYWRKDLYAASLSRYLLIIKNHPEYTDLTEIAKQRASECYLALAKIYEEDPTSDAYVYFKNETPASLKQKALDIKN